MARPVLDTWRRANSLPLGKRLFSWAVALRAPYFRTVRPRVEQVRPGYCEVRAKLRWGVHNHIGTFHAIAMCNMAEAAMGILAEATVPPTHRWIPAGMTVRYLAKAETDLRAIAELTELPAFGDEKFDQVVPVRVLDDNDLEVAHADITIRISVKPPRG